MAIAVAILYQSHANQACLNLDLTVERACNDHRLLCDICITVTYSISVQMCRKSWSIYTVDAIIPLYTHTLANRRSQIRSFHVKACLRIQTKEAYHFLMEHLENRIRTRLANKLPSID